MVIDLPGCAVAGRAAQQCGAACNLVLCAAWEIVTPSEPLPNTRQGYSDLYSRKVRGVVLGDVPSLKKESLDFITIKHTKVEYNVDQKAEIESIIGMAWGLVKPGGVIMVISDKDQLIVLQDEDGNLFLDHADYPGALKAAANDVGMGEVETAKCAYWDKESAEQLVISQRPVEHGFEDPSAQLLQHVYVIERAAGSAGDEARGLVFETWGLDKESVTFLTPPRSPVSGSAECASSSARMSGSAGYGAEGLLAALQAMLNGAVESALVMFDTALASPGLVDSLLVYEEGLDPDWGVLLGSEAGLPFPSSLAAGEPAFYSVRAARALSSSGADARCTPFDAEAAQILMQTNTSVAVASPAFFAAAVAPSGGGSPAAGGAGSPAAGGAGSPAAGGAGSPAAGGAGSPAGGAGARGGGGGRGGGRAPAKERSLDQVPCRLFSFFDCHATHSWDECVTKRDSCGSL